MALVATHTTLPSWWAGLLHRWLAATVKTRVRTRRADTRSEAITHLRERIEQYERLQPSYADDMRSALAQLERSGPPPQR
jgi:hypothetical protein